MSRLIRGLLDYSTASNHEIELEEVSLSELLSDIVADQEVMIDDVKGAFEVGELPLIHADRSMASSLFGNIVSNGLKYRDADRAPIVKVISTEVDGAYEITVSDNGVGFDNRQCDKILNRLLGCISVVTLTDLVSVWRVADQYVIGMAGQCVRSAKLVLGLRSLFEFRFQLNLGKNCRGIHNYASI